jgi:hypothetical protein
MVYRPAYMGGDRRGRRALIVCSCYTTGTNTPGAVVSLFADGRCRGSEAYEGSLFGEHRAKHLQDLALGKLCAERIVGPWGRRET